MRKVHFRRLSALSVAVTTCFTVLSTCEPVRAFAPINFKPSPLAQNLLLQKDNVAHDLPETSIRMNHLSRRRRKTTTPQKSIGTDTPSLPPHETLKSRGANGYRTAIVSAWLACSILFVPLQAQAGFGPSGGATTSPTPGVLKVNVQDLSQKKLQQLIDNTIDDGRLNEFKAQLDAIIDSVASLLSDEETSTEEAQPQEQKDREAPITKIAKSTVPKLDSKEGLQKARGFQAQISSRERLLDRLEAQPQWFNYFAALCGSVTSTLVMHPVDTIKTRLQVSQSNATDATEEDSSIFTNLYEGLSGNLLKEGPPSALYLGVYESVKTSLIRGKLAPIWASLFGASSVGVQSVITADPTYLLSIYLVAGAVGEIIGSIIRAPAEAVKSVVQTQKASSTAEAFELVFSSPEGRSNVFRAWSASALRDVPFGAIQLALFELIKAYILNNPNIDFDSSSLQSEAIIGAFAGGFGSFVTNPMDVITTRIITQSTKEGDKEPLGAIAMGGLIFEEGGLGAFFAGWQARVLYWAPAISIFLTCYCSVRQSGAKFDIFG